MEFFSVYAASALINNGTSAFEYCSMWKKDPLDLFVLWLIFKSGAEFKFQVVEGECEKDTKCAFIHQQQALEPSACKRDL
ncbi:CLUMA_CG004095, isoform A [Clunio marinus]|uniref:CLUMA_CG004095, isoform A n=1 Tax=Clunio marinus TaxID=568069 RepID=A0A1J1HV34_9DIPT|nr:CLUMA_CG004095, isoform A [Clunio marinus]